MAQKTTAGAIKLSYEYETRKIDVSDIVDNLSTETATKPLSAKQGVVLKNLINAKFSNIPAENINSGSTADGYVLAANGEGGVTFVSPTSLPAADNVHSYDSAAEFPESGDEEDLYIANDTGKLYRWNGEEYISLSEYLPLSGGTIDGDLNVGSGLTHVNISRENGNINAQYSGSRVSRAIDLDTSTAKIVLTLSARGVEDYITTYSSRGIKTSDMGDYEIRFPTDEDFSDEQNHTFATREWVGEEISTKADLVDGKVPAAQLPSFVDDVVEYASVSDFPEEGESGKIYVALDTNKTYRWGGSSYAEISESLALGETASTAFPGNRGKALEDAMPLKADLVDGKIPASELPDVGGVHAYDSISDFPASGEADHVYIANDTNKQYRWSGSDYVELSEEEEMEVIEFDFANPSPVTQEQFDKALKGKAVVHRGFYYCNFQRVDISGSKKTVIFVGYHFSGVTGSQVPQDIAIYKTTISLPSDTLTMSQQYSVFDAVRDDSANFFPETDSPSSDGKRIAREKNLAKAQAMIAPEYDPALTYAIGDYCIHQNNLYKCSTAIPTAEAWDISHWTQISASEEFGDESNVEIVNYSSTTPLTEDQIAKAKKGKLIIHYANAGFDVICHLKNDYEYGVGKLLFEGQSYYSGQTAHYVPRDTRILVTRITVNVNTGAMALVFNNYFCAVGSSDAENFFDAATNPASGGKRLVRELNIHGKLLPDISSGDAGKSLKVNSFENGVEWADDDALRQGYYYAGVFWEEPAHINRMPDSYGNVYLDLHTGMDYYYDKTTSAYKELVPHATQTQYGATKIYQSLGSNTDGAPSQKVVYDALGTKQALNTITISGAIPVGSEDVDIPLSEVQADFISEDADLVRINVGSGGSGIYNFNRTWLGQSAENKWFLSLVVDPSEGGTVCHVGSVVTVSDPDHPGQYLQKFRVKRHYFSKYDVGLGNVDNTSDIDKPISRATQQALDTKVELGLSELNNETLALFTPAGMAE